MLRPLRGLLALSVALTVSACDSGGPDEPGGGGTPPPTTVTYGETVVTAATRAFSDAEAAAVTEVSEDRSRVAVTTAALAADPVAVGDVIVAGPSDAAPDGLLRRVTALAEDGRTTVLTTESASLEDVVVEGTASASLALRPDGATAIALSDDARLSARGDAFVVSLNSASFDIDGDIMTTDDRFFVTLDASFQPVVDVAMAWSEGEAVSVDVTSSTAATVALDVEFPEGVRAASEVPFRVAQYRLAPVAIALGASPVSIVVRPVVSFDVRLNGEASDNASFEASFSLDLEDEIQATATRSPARTATAAWTDTEGTFRSVAQGVSGSTDVSFAPAFRTGVELFGQAFVELATKAAVEGDVDVYSSPWYGLELASAASAEIQTAVSGPQIAVVRPTFAGTTRETLAQAAGAVPFDVPPRIFDVRVEPSSSGVDSGGRDCDGAAWRVEFEYEDPNGDAAPSFNGATHAWARANGTLVRQTHSPGGTNATGSRGTARVTVCPDARHPSIRDEVFYYDAANLESNPLSFQRPNA